MLDGSADTVVYGTALKTLSRVLHRTYQQAAVILIDEYDVPIQSGFTNGYYDEITLFLRNFLSSGLKDNTSLYKGVLTGVLRIAKESIFSGLNNISVYGILDERFAPAFGFTEAEVDKLLSDLGQSERLAEVRRWYNGYRFAGHVIYNPWSLMKFAQDPDQGFRPY